MTLHVKCGREEMCNQFDKNGTVPKDDFGNVTSTLVGRMRIVTSDTEGDEECNSGE
jgi:hypothetical protein